MFMFRGHRQGVARLTERSLGRGRHLDFHLHGCSQERGSNAAVGECREDPIDRRRVDGPALLQAAQAFAPLSLVGFRALQGRLSLVAGQGRHARALQLVHVALRDGGQLLGLCLQRAAVFVGSAPSAWAASSSARVAASCARCATPRLAVAEATLEVASVRARSKRMRSTSPFLSLVRSPGSFCAASFRCRSHC